MKRLLNCLVFSLLGLFFLGLVGLIAVALSGVVEVPFLSSIFYRRPPHLPRATITSSFDMEKKLLDSVSEKKAIEISEGELSSLLREATKDKLRDVRVNVFSDKILLLVTLRTKRPIYLTFVLTPKGKSGDLEIRNMKVGYLPIPVGWIRNFFPTKGTISLKDVFVREGIEFESLELRDEKVLLWLDWEKMLRKGIKSQTQ